MDKKAVLIKADTLPERKGKYSSCADAKTTKIRKKGYDAGYRKGYDEGYNRGHGAGINEQRTREREDDGYNSWKEYQ